MSLPLVQLPPVALTLFHTLSLTLFHTHFHFTPTLLPFSSCFNSIVIIAKKDLLLSYTCNVVNLSHFDNSKIRKAVLPRTESDYKRALIIFDKLVCSSV
jgi:hypothetical protein